MLTRPNADVSSMRVKIGAVRTEIPVTVNVLTRLQSAILFSDSCFIVSIQVGGGTDRVKGLRSVFANLCHALVKSFQTAWKLKETAESGLY